MKHSISQTLSLVARQKTLDWLFEKIRLCGVPFRAHEAVVLRYLTTGPSRCFYTRRPRRQHNLASPPGISRRYRAGQAGHIMGPCRLILFLLANIPDYL